MFNRKELYEAFEGSWEPAGEDSELLDNCLLEQYVLEAEAECGVEEDDCWDDEEFWDEVEDELDEQSDDFMSVQDIIESDKESEREYRRLLLDKLYRY